MLTVLQLKIQNTTHNILEWEAANSSAGNIIQSPLHSNYIQSTSGKGIGAFEKFEQ